MNSRKATDGSRTRYNISLRVISGESRTVNEDTIIDWKSRLLNIMDPENAFNCDETDLLLQVNARLGASNYHYCYQ